MFNIFDYDTAQQDFEYILGYMGKPVLINGQPRQVLITNTNLQTNYDDKKITSLEHLNRGDIIEYNDKTLMIISELTDERYYKYKAIARLLPHTITVNHNCTFIEVPCYIDSGTFGVSDGKYISVADGSIHIHTQDNEQTRQLAIDDRFIKGGQAYKIVGIDTLSRDGIITLTCEKDLINPAIDDVENELAGWFDCQQKEPDKPEELHIMIKSNSSAPEEIRQNQTKQYYAEVYDGDLLIEDATVTWQLFADDKTSPTTLASIVEHTDTNCKVKNNNATSGYVQLKAVWNDDETIESWFRIQMRTLI